MFYTIYQITCTLNRKIYIGKHQTTDLNDGYMGSGKILKKAIDLYGIENFQKEILHVFDNEEEMNKMEAEIVNEQFLSRDDVYNLCIGGQGGFSYINSVIWTREKRKIHNNSIRIKNRSSDSINMLKNLPRTLEWNKNISKSKIGSIPWNKDKTLSDETKAKMSKSHSGTNNSQFGTRWITNGTENKKIKKEESIPEGWYKGRKIKKNPF